MPPVASQSQSLAASFVKGYKGLVSKFHQQSPDDIYSPLSSLLLETNSRINVAAHWDLQRAVSRFQAAVVDKEERLLEQLRHTRQRARRRFRQKLQEYGLAHWHNAAEDVAAAQSAATPAAPSATTIPDTTATELQQLQTHLPLPATDQAAVQSLYGTNGLLRAAILSGIANLSHAFMHGFNTTHVTGGEVVRAALERPRGQALITVCNHVAAMDDPLVVAAITPPDYYTKPDALRWTLCASDKCFKYAALAPLFTAAKVLPIERGAGLAQPGMTAAETRLAQGDWVHVFPEGTRSRDPERLGRCRRGVGRLVAAAAASESGLPPLVVPFVHVGMEDVMPVGKSIPATGNQVHILVGQPIPVDDLLATARASGWTDDALYAAVTQRVEQRLQHMHSSLLSSVKAGTPLVLEQEAMWGAPQQDVTTSSSLSPTPAQPAACASMDVAAVSNRWFTNNMLKGDIWDRVAFTMWHRVWAARAAVASATDAMHMDNPPVAGPRSAYA